MTNSNNIYIPLRVFTNYSIGESIIRIADLVSTISNLKLPAVAMCNRMNIFGIIEFTYYCIKKKIKPVIGCLLKIHDTDGFLGYIPVYVQNHVGYRCLSKILTKAYMDHSADPHVMLFDILSSEELIVLTGDTEGPLFNLINTNKIQKAEELLCSMKEFLKNRLYVEINNKFESRITNEIMDLAYKLNVSLVGTNCSTFCTSEQYEAAFIFKCIHEKEFFEEDVFQQSGQKEEYIWSPDEFKKTFKKEAILNTIQISERCSFVIPQKAPESPLFSQSYSEDTELFKKDCIKNLELRIANIDEEKKEVYRKRLEFEMDIINSKNFGGYFLIVSDFVIWAKDNGILVGAGRGSGAGSLCAWVMSICDIDPIMYGLIFERFLNPGRISMPDFDIDFSQDKRGDVIKYVSKKYGIYRVAHIITFGAMKARMVIRDVGRALKMPFSQAFRISSMIPTSLTEVVTLEKALESSIVFKELVEKGDAQIKKLIDISQLLEGLLRQSSSHASGIVINTTQDISENIPLFRDAQGEICTQFNMNEIEQVGLIKFDFLGLRTLTVVDKCLELIQKHQQKTIIINDICLMDHEVFKLISSTYVMGVFQLESSGMRHVIQQLQPDTLDDVMALIALFRPGPIKYIPQYVKRKAGLEKIEYLDPRLEPILSVTFGIIVFQEQVMEIARVIGGYSYGEADMLRRAMGKKKAEEMKAQENRFLEGARKNNLSVHAAQALFGQMAQFAGYAFNKSHAASYALLTYTTAFLKKYFIKEFIVANLNTELDNSDKILAFVNEAKKFSVKISAPCINRSIDIFKLQDGEIIFGINAIKGVGSSISHKIIAHSPYTSWNNFIQYNKDSLNKKTLEQLIISGSLDVLEPNRKKLISLSQDFLQKKTSQNIISETEIKDYSFLERMYMERQALGFFLTYHPVQFYFDRIKIVPIKNLDYISLHSETYFNICMIEDIIRRKTRTEKSSVFAFLQVTDHLSHKEIIIFSQVLTTYEQYIEKNNIVLIQSDCYLSSDNSYKTSVKAIMNINSFIQTKTQKMTITLKSSLKLPIINNILKEALTGPTQVEIITPELIINYPKFVEIPVSLITDFSWDIKFY